MPPPKQKRSDINSTSAHKRPKYAEPSDEETAPRNEELWEAVCILKERTCRRKLQYLIKWKGIDPATGRTYKPTWEPEENPNALLLAAWEQEKAAKGIARKPRPGRKSRVIESSPEASVSRPSTARSRTSTPISAPTAASRAPRVQIRKPGDFDPADYEQFSQLAASVSPSQRSDAHGTDLDSSQLFAAGSSAAHYHSSGVVEDSQSSEGEASFIAPTQQTTGTTQHSSIVNGTQEHVTEDSGLLDIVQGAASRAHSPARSIPETIYDTTADLQSQRRREASLERAEVQDTLETADGPLLLVSEHDQGADDESLQPALQSVLEEDDQQQGQPKELEQVSSSNTDRATPHLVETRPSPDIDQATPQLQTFTANNEDAAVHDRSQTDEREVGDQITGSGADETAALGDLQQADSQDQGLASLAERPELDETAEFSFHSQHPLHLSHDQAQAAVSQSGSEGSGDSVPQDKSAASIGGPERFQHRDQPHPASSANNPIQASSHTENHQPQARSSLLVTPSQAVDDELLSEFLEPQYIQDQSPVVAQPIHTVDETVVQSSHEPHSSEDEVRRQDFAPGSQPPPSTEQSAVSREQNARVVHVDKDLSTQEDLTESIRPSIEQGDVVVYSSPASRHDSSQETPEPRHDSSQETPEPRRKSADQSSSPIPQPPTHSLATVNSQAPPRPETPIPTSSLSNMASQDTEKMVAEKLKAALAAAQAANPFTPTSRVRNSALSPAGTVSTPPAISNPVTSSRRLLRTGASDGARSPSTVPDRSPAPSAPTSLRTVALSHANQPTTEEAHEETARALNIDPPVEPAKQVDPAVPAIITTEPTVHDASSSDNMEMSDGDAVDDDDTASLLNDDLHLAAEEYIIPLLIESRQSDMYSKHIKAKKKVLMKFLKDSDGVQSLEEVEEIVSHFKAIETHIDLVFAEAGSAPDNVMNPQTQIEFAAQFGQENSVKFRFLHWMFYHLRDHEIHVVLVVDEENDALFDIIEGFCKANFFHYNMPTRGVEADPADYKGSLLVSIFPRSASPITRPAHVIICLDGFQEARCIRQKNWACNPDIEIVPVLHLVIPRTVGHIERYLSSSLDKRKRLHTILASLAHMMGELGKPIDEDTPRATVVGRIVADWLITPAEDRGPLPLTSIGSVNDVIEYQTQESPTSATSPAPERLERSKRPHDDEELDPAKRMRFTPQPVTSSSINENEITRISDSMPGTATVTEDPAALRAQIARLEEAYQKERALRESEKAHFAEQEIMWDKQQTVYEDQVKQYRLLLGKQQTTENQLETATKNNETLRERLAARTTELQTLSARLDEQLATHLLSDDEKLAEISRLRKDLATANEDKIRAQKGQESTDKMLDYTKEEYRKASDAASSSQQSITALEAQVAQLSHAASGQPATLKKLHLDRQYDNQALQLRNLKAENNTLKKSLAMKEEELARAKLSSERMGVRTRGGSVTPQPGRVRSRAASPSGTRVASLRNG